MDYCIIAVSEVYGTPNPTIPEGYKKIDFRPYKVGDTILSSGAKSAIDIIEGDNSWGRPYIILEKLPPKPEVIKEKAYSIYLSDIYRTDCVVVPSRYTYEGFRPPTSGEIFLTPNLGIGTGSMGDNSPRIILKKKVD